MPWAVVNTLTVASGDSFAYRSFLLPSTPGVVAWGISFVSSDEVLRPRLRNAFAAPFVGIDSQTLFGPSESLFFGLTGTDGGIHVIDYRWLDGYSGLRARAAVFGVAVAPDRGSAPATAALWRLI